MSSAPIDAMTGGSDPTYGLELVELEEGRATGDVVVREELKHADGTVHTAVYAAIAERLTALATARAVVRNGETAAPMSNQTSFLRPIAEGVIHAVAEARHRGRTTWVWEVEFSDDQGRLCVLTRMTIAVSAGSEER